MSGALWFGVVVLVSVVVSGSMGIILKTVLADSKQDVRNEGVGVGGETSRDGKSGVVRVGGVDARKEWSNGYLAGFYDGVGKEDVESARRSMELRLTGRYYSR